MTKLIFVFVAMFFTFKINYYINSITPSSMTLPNMSSVVFMCIQAEGTCSISAHPAPHSHCKKHSHVEVAQSYSSLIYCRQSSQSLLWILDIATSNGVCPDFYIITSYIEDAMFLYMKDLLQISGLTTDPDERSVIIVQEISLYWQKFVFPWTKCVTVSQIRKQHNSKPNIFVE